MSFTDPNTAAVLRAAGYEQEHIPEHWEDDGGPESGPMLSGGPAVDYWSREGDFYVIDENGELVDSGYDPYWDYSGDI